MNRVRRILPFALPLTGVLIGLILLLVPELSYRQSRREESRRAADYERAVRLLDEEELAQLWRSAADYNALLSETDVTVVLDEDTLARYRAALDPLGDGTIGIVEIPKIDVCLPFRHTAEAEILEETAGHVEWTSLPTGDRGTHTAVGAHNGYLGRILFERLPELETGDRFRIRVLERTFTYEVDCITEVTPDEIEHLFPVPGEAYCTLMTCTDSDAARLLVRGTLIREEESSAAGTGSVLPDR